MRQFRTEAIILRRTNYGEADRILNVLTPVHGKISVIAKGVRKPKSKLAGGLELLAVSDLTVLMGKSEVGVVTSARIKDFFKNILTDYDRLQLAYEVIKQINKATETVTDGVFYDLLKSSLGFINNLSVDRQLMELWFWVNFASLLGGEINLQTDHEGNKLQADKTYDFDINSKAFFENPRGAFDADHIKLLRLSYHNTPLTLSKIKGLNGLDFTALTRLAMGMVG